MKIENPKQPPCKMKLEFCTPVNTIVYRCGIAFSLTDKIFTFMFCLQSAIQTIVANKTEKLEDTRKTLKNDIQIEP